MSGNVLDLPIARLAAELADEQISLGEYFSAALDRIDEAEGEIAALLPEQGRRERLLAEAEELRRRFPRGSRPPLYGVLVGVKDLFKVEGTPRTAGSRLPATAFEGAESLIVTRLRELGAVVLGITVSTEFAYFSPGPTRNPRNLEHTPGGSSSGSAAAVAAGYCRLALGTQTIGSISRPASFCGIAGLKPSFGKLSAEGVFPFSWSADHVGFLAGSVGDARTAYAAVTGAVGAATQGRSGAAESAGDLGERVFLVPDDAYLRIAEEETLDRFEETLTRLEARGAVIRRTTVLSDIEEIRAAHRRMIAREFAETHRELVERYRELYTESSLSLIEEGRRVSDEELREARVGRARVRGLLDERLLAKGAAAWLSPATVGEAPRGIGSTGNPVMNLPWTYAGVPTVATPAGSGRRGLPLGLQIAGAFDGEESLLEVAAALEPVVTGRRD